MKILSIYSSLNGNTEKVAYEIEKAGLETKNHVESVNVSQFDSVVDLLSYDFIFIGSGVYTWLPGKKMMTWIEKQLEHARKSNLILPGSPKIAGKFVCVYATYAGPHTGVAEAVPAVKYMGQLFDHMGITILDEWYIPGEFVPSKMQAMNIKGRLGNIEGRPNEIDLKEIHEKTLGLISSLNGVVQASLLC